MTVNEAINIIKSECYVFNPLNFDKSTMVNTALDIAIQALEQEPKIGHWIYLKHNKARCSECDDVVLIAQMYGNANYCPNCGARMVEPQESEDKE